MLETEGVDAARAVLQRGIRTIEVAEEREKLNCFKALMNLEKAYGTDETYEEAFQQALRSNHPEAVLQHAAKRAVAADETEEAEELLKRLCRSHNTNTDNWLRLIDFYFVQVKDEDKAAEAFKKAAQSLDNSLELSLGFVKLEYSHGNPERGRTLMEKLVMMRPKRTDLWSVYLDLESRHSAEDRVRDLFERALSVKLAKKAHSLLVKKYVQYEESHGHTERARTLDAKLKD
jgi:rRNA biogenesis protein RRP5